jgi:hypothetical protein
LSEFFCVTLAQCRDNPPKRAGTLLAGVLLRSLWLTKENIMKHKSISLLLVSLFLASYSSLALAQQASSNDWAVVRQLRTNEKLVVKKMDGKELKGEMIEASDTALTIDRDGKPLSIPRSDVRQVYVIS